MVNALSTYLDQPQALVAPTPYSQTLQRVLHLCFALTLLGAASHFYTAHYVDGLWDVASIAVGFYVVRPLLRDGATGYSLRYLTRYSLWNLFNVGLYVAAFIYQLYYGYPPVLPLNPPGGWESLNKSQKDVAIMTYDVEQFGYIAIAVVLALLYRELKAQPYRSVKNSAVRGESYQSLTH